MSEILTSNQSDESVSELAARLKRAIETGFDHVRVRGELGRVTIARSGHMYADLKDDKAVLNTVMWKGQVSALPFRPEEGLEVIAEGRLSIYAGRSNYQLIATSLRPAGAGALMALLEARKKKLAGEGLFDPVHKKKLPFLPRRIGVVTSPTGAVIRDILHRIVDRFPAHVVLWPALVQGDAAAAQIEAGIRGFNALPKALRPDVLIVGRGGGSVEDLWPFNEERVVRAAFDSQIPLISAVGHETDTTLIDYVSDARAPTPTGAAEMAVPVRRDLIVQIEEDGARLKRALLRRVQTGHDRLKAARLPPPENLLRSKRQGFDYAEAGLKRALRGAVDKKRLRLTQIAPRLRIEALGLDLVRRKQRLSDVSERARPALLRRIERGWDRLSTSAKLLEALSYQATLKRGFTLVTTLEGGLVRSAATAQDLPLLNVQFSDGRITAQPILDHSDDALSKDQTPSSGKAFSASKTSAPDKESASAQLGPKDNRPVSDKISEPTSKPSPDPALGKPSKDRPPPDKSGQGRLF